MKKRFLTAEEKRLWDLVTEHDQPMNQKFSEDSTPVKVRATAPGGTSGRHVMPPPMPSTAGGNYAAPLDCGAYAGVDHNTANRFRKGETPIDATLDLHGMTTERAGCVFRDFINTHYAQGARCLLVITGKGIKKTMTNDIQSSLSQGIVRGVLRESLPQWLAEPSLRPLILAFDIAKPKHGGSGAFYILLKRKR